MAFEKPFALAEAHARYTDPGTSHMAAASVHGVTGLQEAILKELVKPQTDEHLIAAIQAAGIPASESGIRTRRKELQTMGKVIDTGKRQMTRCGRKTIVWGLAR